MAAKRDLAENEVRWIVELYESPMGIYRIAKITGIGLWQIRGIVRNETYTDITGGKIARGLRSAAVWKHSTKSYEEVQQCLQ